MSQPFNRGSKVPAPGNPDETLGEFWEEDPWAIAAKHNLSCYERNRAFLNVGGRNFVDISYLTGTDSDGDGRCAVAADLNNDGRPELVVRHAGGGPLMIYENRFPKRRFLKVTLRGTESNALGIGAKLTAFAAGRQVVRELYPVNSYRSQAPSLVHFGLGDADHLDSLTIRWPSGRVQKLRGVPADRHIVIQEGSDRVHTVQESLMRPS